MIYIGFISFLLVQRREVEGHLFLNEGLRRLLIFTARKPNLVNQDYFARAELLGVTT